MTPSLQTLEWHNEFVLSRELRALGRHSELVAAHRAGDLVAVARGAYRHRDACETRPHLVADDAFVALIRATHLIAARPLVFSSFAAAALFGLPIIGRWPKRIDVASEWASGGRSNGTVRRSFTAAPPDWIELDGLRVTSLARTVVDVGRVGTFPQAVTLMDSALHGRQQTTDVSGREPVSITDVRNQLEIFGRGSGSARCAGVVAFADGCSGSPGESLSRAQMQLLGFPAPELQKSFYDQRGFIGTVDFWWPQFRLIGEFDGHGKYLREEYANGRTPAQIIIEEKIREDRLRALGNSMARWDWSVAMSLAALRRCLLDAGLACARR